MGDILDDIDEAMAKSIAVGITVTAVGTWSMPEEETEAETKDEWP